MPWQGGHRLMYYNKDLFKEAGITTLPETWDDLVDAAKKTTKFEGGTMVQQGIILPWGPDGATSFCGFFYAAGGRWMDDTAEKPMFNSEAGKAALGFWVDLTQKHKVSSPKFLFGQGIQGSFVLGKSAMQIAGPWNLGPYPKQNPKLNFGIMFPPARTKGGPRGWDDAPWKLLVNPKTRYADPAWEIIKLWTSKVSLVNAMSIGVVSYRKSALEEFKPKANEHWKVFIDAMPYNRARPFKNWRAIAVRFGAQIEKALLGTVTVEQALADGEKEVKKAIDEGAQL
ncbi:MAG: extracellular solute-binding protein [Chloroflexi bacterium]|nr:extracellular solute-binding protein [Chloroflexota bacterium]